MWYPQIDTGFRFPVSIPAYLVTKKKYVHNNLSWNKVGGTE